MAKKALFEMKNGTEREIHIDDVTDEILYDPELKGIFCLGVTKEDKEPCRVEVIPVRRGPRTGFRVNRGCHHKIGCDEDKCGKALIKRRFDRLGKKANIEDLLWLIIKSEESPKKPKKEQDPDIDEKDAIENIDEFTDDRPIKPGLKKAKKVKVLCEIFSRVDPEDVFADKRVGEIYIGHRNIVDVRKKGLSEGQVAIVICAHINKERRKKLAPNVKPWDVVLQDAYVHDDNAFDEPLICIVRCSESIKEQILEKGKNKCIAIFGKWRPDSNNPGTYICNCYNKEQVFFADKEFFE